MFLWIEGPYVAARFPFGAWMVFLAVLLSMASPALVRLAAIFLSRRVGCSSSALLDDLESPYIRSRRAALDGDDL